MKFNINGYVKVQLTDYGRRVHEDDWYDLLGHVPSLTYRPPAEDEEGWSKWQMWNLMQSFGEHIGMAREPVFRSDIEICEKNTPSLCVCEERNSAEAQQRATAFSADQIRQYQEQSK